jgi:hypothetical protein
VVTGMLPLYSEVHDMREEREEERELPLEHYQDLSVEQILVRALALSPRQIEKVVDFERRHQNRRLVTENIERIAA